MQGRRAEGYVKIVFHTLQQSDDVTHARLKNVIALCQQHADTMVGVELSSYASHATGM